MCRWLAQRLPGERLALIADPSCRGRIRSDQARCRVQRGPWCARTPCVRAPTVADPHRRQRCSRHSSDPIACRRRTRPPSARRNSETFPRQCLDICVHITFRDEPAVTASMISGRGLSNFVRENEKHNDLGVDRGEQPVSEPTVCCWELRKYSHCRHDAEGPRTSACTSWLLAKRCCKPTSSMSPVKSTDRSAVFARTTALIVFVVMRRPSESRLPGPLPARYALGANTSTTPSEKRDCEAFD